MPSGKSSKTARNARAIVTTTKPTPWGTIAAVVALVLFAGAISAYAYIRYQDVSVFKPTAERKDPSTQIEGIVIKDYGAGRGHIGADRRVAYDQSPPFGGPHDGTWAACNGVVYSTPVRSENMVHSLEHGAVWMAYNPERITGSALQSLQDRVQGGSYLMLSPYPGLDTPISLQSWGHQLKLTDPADERIDHFIQSLRLNQYTYPEIGASCDAVPGLFNPATPPPFVATPPGPDAVPLDFAGGLDGATGTGTAPVDPPSVPNPPAGG